MSEIDPERHEALKTLAEAVLKWDDSISVGDAFEVACSDLRRAVDWYREWVWLWAKTHEKPAS